MTDAAPDARAGLTGSPSLGLRALLIALTGATGLIDAASYLGVGHVFVANMTGNVVLLGFALSGAAGLSITASLAAVAGFLVGAAAGGRWAVASERRSNVWLSTASAAQTVLVGNAAVLTAPCRARPYPCTRSTPHRHRAAPTTGSSHVHPRDRSTLGACPRPRLRGQV
ncbi:MAG: hypothetical protein QOJ68_3911, partial [Blastococcus sp.]|nr:hypothetical protein [Blastococcus sp.]